MDFTFGEDADMVRQTAHEFVRRDLLPQEPKFLNAKDPAERTAIVDAATGSLKEMGLYSAGVPEAFGGGGLGPAAGNPKYRQALLKDPKSVVEKQVFNISLSGGTVKALEEAPDVLYVLVPRATAAGELDDSDLEKVAGGGDINVKLGGKVECSQGALQTMIQINLG